MTRYVVSSGVVTTDPKGFVVYNKITGEMHEISEEVLKLLSVFKEPRGIDEALSLLRVKKRELPDLREFLQSLIDSAILITEDDAQKKHTQGIVPGAKVQRPARGLLSVPVRDPDTLENEDIVFLGSPFDSGSTGYPGSRFGPNRMRELSSDAFEYHADIFTKKSCGWYSHETERNILDQVSMADVGNVLHYIGEGFDSYFERTRGVVEIIKRSGAFPVIIGGDHSVSYATIGAFRDDSIGVIHIDAHTDLGVFIPGIPNNHGNVFARLREEGIVKHLVQLGVRSFAGEVPCSAAYGILSTKQLHERGPEVALSLLDSQRKYFLSLDIDVLDPAFAPGTGTAVPGGVTPSELTGLLTVLAKHVQFVGCDLVEVNPMLDRNDATSLLAIETLVHFLGEVFV